MMLKNKLMIAILACMLALVGCSDTKEEATEEAKTEDAQMSAETTEAVEKSETMMADSKEKADAMKTDAVEVVEEKKEEAKDALDDTLNKADDVKDEVAEKAKEACIKAKKALGESTDDC